MASSVGAKSKIMMHAGFSGEDLAVDLEEESTFRSKHTGAELKRIRIGIVAQTLQAHRLLLLKINCAENEGITSTWRKANFMRECSSFK